MGQRNLPLLNRTGNSIHWDSSWNGFYNYSTSLNKEFFLKKLLSLIFIDNIFSNIIFKKINLNKSFFRKFTYEVKLKKFKKFKFFKKKLPYFTTKIWFLKFQNWFIVILFFYNTAIKKKLIFKKKKIKINMQNLLKQKIFFKGGFKKYF